MVGPEEVRQLEQPTALRQRSSYSAGGGAGATAARLAWGSDAKGGSGIRPEAMGSGGPWPEAGQLG